MAYQAFHPSIHEFELSNQPPGSSGFNVPPFSGTQPLMPPPPHGVMARKRELEWHEMRRVYEEGFPSNAMAFDSEEELLWVGFGNGRLTSFLQPPMARYTSIAAWTTGFQGLIPCSRGIVSIFSDRVRLHSRGCLLLAENMDNATGELSCVTLLGGHRRGQTHSTAESHVAVGTRTGELQCLDAGSQLKLVTHLNTPAGASVISCGRMLAVGGEDGKLRLLDNRLRSTQIHQTLDAHTGPLTAVACQDDLVVTCGMLSRSVNPYDQAAPAQVFPDQIVRVFDLRTVKQLSSLSFASMPDPSMIAFLSSDVPSLGIASSSGKLLITDVTGDPSTISFAQVTNGQGAIDGISSIAAGTSGEVLAVGTVSGAVVQWGKGDPCSCRVNVQSKPTPMPPFPAPKPMRAIDPLELASPASYHALRPTPEHVATGPLCSSFKSTPWLLDAPVFCSPRRLIRQELLDQVNQQGFLGTIPNPVPDLPPNSLLCGPGYAACYQEDPHGGDELSRPQHQSGKNDIPWRYRRMSHKLGSKGHGQFCFQRYNRTLLPGLENTLPLSFINPVLQMLYLITPLREAVKKEQFNPKYFDGKTPALSCELGLLFHALEQLPVGECFQPRNFALAFQRCSEALALGLLGNSGKQSKKSLSTRIQLFHRFLLSQIHKEMKLRIADHLYGYDVKTTNYFVKTESEATETQTRVFVTDLIFSSKTLQYPNTTEIKEETKAQSTECSDEEERPAEVTTDGMAPGTSSAPQAPLSSSSGDSIASFGEVLYQSLCRETRARTWCAETQSYAPIRQARHPGSLPQLLAVHCGEATNVSKAHWRSGCHDTHLTFWVPEMLKLKLDQKGSLWVGELVENPGLSSEWRWAPEQEPSEDSKGKVYKLTGVVSRVTEDGDDNDHLILHTKLPPEYAEQMKPKKSFSQSKGSTNPNEDVWLIANDFLVQSSSVEDARAFHPSWKDPCILLYRIDADLERIEDEANAQSQIDLNVAEVFSIPSLSNSLQMEHVVNPVDPSMLPGNGDLVAIDTEFVAIDLEEASIKANGKRVINKQGRLALARFSAIDARYDLTIIDDYVIQTEPTVDYLTRFSGITAEDLDLNNSRHHLVNLRTVFLKFRHLVDSGCVFIGHGLAKDFRVMNVYVPPEQVKDTVELWSLPGQRKISLRFLASYLLRLDIQGETHDSVEDARIALELYRKYLKVKELNVYESTVKGLYEYGRLHDWKVGGANLGINNEESPILASLSAPS